jgi:hypothetical protein
MTNTKPAAHANIWETPPSRERIHGHFAGTLPANRADQRRARRRPVPWGSAAGGRVPDPHESAVRHDPDMRTVKAHALFGVALAAVLLLCVAAWDPRLTG